MSNAIPPRRVNDQASWRLPGERHAIIGCGSTNVAGPDSDGVYDCGDCGMWFLPQVQTEGVDDVVDGDEIPPRVLDRIVQRTAAAAAASNAGTTTFG